MSKDTGPTVEDAGSAAEDARLTAEDTDSTTGAAGPAVTTDQATIRGTVTYPWGNVVNAKITVGERRTASDNVGKYELSELTPGVYDLVTEAPFPGYEKSTLKVEVAASETKIVDVCLDFVKAVVDGHVYGQDGKPVVGAIISGVLSGKDMETAKTDERGYFMFQRVTPGDRFIRVNAQGYVGETRDFTAKEGTPTTLEFRLTPAPCKIYGTH